MLMQTDFDAIIAAVPSFQTKWLQLKERGELRGPVSVDFAYYITLHLIERAAADDFTDFTLLFEALETPLSNSSTELYDSLTMGFLESLICACESSGVSLLRVRECIAGDRTRSEWDAAYNYIHAGDASET
jgi:hypothetical protein